MFEYDGPLYRGIMDSLKERILGGRLAPDDRMPTVRDIEATYKCSHATATRVLREMCREGYAYVQGNATYVRDRGQAEVTLRIPATGRRRRNEIYPPGPPGRAQVHGAGLVVPPDYVADVLETGRGTEIVRREVTVSDDRHVVQLAVHWHPAELALFEPRLLETGAADGANLAIVGGAVAEAAAGRMTTFGLDSFHARTADEREARLLEIPVGSTVLARITTWEDDQGVTEYMEAVHPVGVIVTYEHRDPADTDD